MQQLLHICSEHFDSKEKEEDKDKKDKKEKEKKESSADMGAHQVGKCGLGSVFLEQELAFEGFLRPFPLGLGWAQRLKSLGAGLGAPCLVLRACVPPCRAWRCWGSHSLPWVRRSVRRWACARLATW